MTLPLADMQNLALRLVVGILEDWYYVLTEKRYSKALKYFPSTSTKTFFLFIG
jgi:hypothetical protein